VTGLTPASVVQLCWTHAKEKQETVSDFLLSGVAGRRLVFSFEGSGQVGSMMESCLIA